MADRHLSKRETADFLGVSTRQVDRWDADRSDLRSFPPSRRIAGRKRWLESAIHEWAESQTQGT